MAYLSHSGSSFAPRRRSVASWNWRLILMLAANTVGWLVIAKLVIQAL